MERGLKGWDQRLKLVEGHAGEIQARQRAGLQLGEPSPSHGVCLLSLYRDGRGASYHKESGINSILKTLDDEAYRRRMGRELNKGEASHDLSRFLCFGKEGVLRGREFGDQIHTFSCLSILHNAVVAWNMMQMDTIVAQLRAEGHQIADETLSHVTPLIRKHINPFGRYHFDLTRMRQDLGNSPQGNP